MTAYPVPQVNWLDGVPAEEHRMASHAAHQLHLLHSYVRDFGHALEVFDESQAFLGPDHETHLRGMARMKMAAHFGALTVYHFQSTIQSIRFCLKRSPALARFVDMGALDAAIGRFRDEFPNFKEVRNSTGHYADFIFKPADIDAHRNSDGTAFIHGTLMGRTLTYTRDNTLIGLEMSKATLEKLELIQLEYFGAFRRACGPRPQG